MTKIDQYKDALQSIPDWDTFLLENSGLPGPRANLELLSAAAELASEERLLAYCSIPLETALVDQPQVFLVCCGVAGLGKLIAGGKEQYFKVLHTFASDPRWRVREAVAIALQTVGDANMRLLLEEMHLWKTGNPMEQRAVVAGLCEPRLLKDRAAARQVLGILDEVTGYAQNIEDRRSEAFTVLKKGLSYGWSVAVAADPEDGKPLMEKWVSSHDRVIRAIMKENLSKNRLVKMDADWVERMRGELR